MGGPSYGIASRRAQGPGCNPRPSRWSNLARLNCASIGPKHANGKCTHPWHARVPSGSAANQRRLSSVLCVADTIRADREGRFIPPRREQTNKQTTRLPSGQKNDAGDASTLCAESKASKQCGTLITQTSGYRNGIGNCVLMAQGRKEASRACSSSRRNPLRAHSS
jgi:hypothetical protein